MTHKKSFVPQTQDQIGKISPYQPGMPIEALARTNGLDPGSIIKLASNENPLGMSPLAQQALRNLQNIRDAARYPDGYQLIQALAEHHRVNTSQIILGNGSNDVLDLVARVFLGPSAEAISARYAFSVYPLVTSITGAKNAIVAAKDYGHDLPAMLAAITPSTKVIWIANPNNPTGTFVPYDEVKAFMAGVPKNIIVVLDEAYYDYLPSDKQVNSVEWLADFPNLIITRTFSKIYGLAGLRIGYALASPTIIELLNRVRQPFNVNHLASAAAIRALQDKDFIRLSLKANETGMSQLVAGCKKLGIEYIPSFGNFIAIKLDNATEANQQLLAKGIIVRPLASQGLTNWLRVTIGLEEENARFLEELTGIVTAD